jgi:outer membrane receptor protein involved in Fe transport
MALLNASSFAQQSPTISGSVVDPAGAAIRDAAIELRVHEQRSNTRTDDQGRFVIDLGSSKRSPTIAQLIVGANGFATKRLELTLANQANPIEVRLEPAPITARIQVEANDPTNVADDDAVLSDGELARAGAVTIDDALRQVPGFSLFRRSGSLTANPTSQGVSLRGVGANGASRAVVMFDGVPLNSPFGSWIYWNRVPRAAIESIAITNGATSDVYGSGALGGVINLESRRVEEPFFATDLSAGNEGTVAASVVAATLVNNFGITASAQVLRTGGYVLVTEDNRGAVDTPAGTADVSGYLTISRTLRNDGRFFLRANSFGESRRNGTPIQINDTRIWSVDLGIDKQMARSGNVSARIYGSREIFNQNFSAVATDRNSESLTNRQRNPSQQFGAALQWQRVFAGRHVIVAGFEGREVRGHSAEVTFNASRTTAQIDAGGRQTTFAGFGQDSLRFGGWIINAGGRLDRWSNRGFSNRNPVSGVAASASFPEQIETAFSPRASISRTIGSGIIVSGSFYRAFRAPTLNELYRGFRVGNVVTNANSDLRAERLTGGEAGFAFRTSSERVTTRANFFWSQITEPIANVTISSTATLITRQRQNLGAIRARGLEASSTFRLGQSVSLATEYLLTDTTILRFPVNRALEGLLVPQIPRHQFSFQLTYNQRSWTAALQARFVSTQFDDDQNVLRLHPFFTMDAEVSRRFSERCELYVASQNLTGVRYDVSRTPVLTTGPPALVRVGMRVTLR